MGGSYYKMKSISIPAKTLYKLFLLIIALLIYIVGAISDSDIEMRIGVVLTFASIFMIVMAYDGKGGAIFLASFFAFLVGQIFATLVSPKFTTYTRNSEILSHIYFSLIISLCAFGFGCSMANRKYKNRGTREVLSFKDSGLGNIALVRQVSLILFCFCSVFEYAEALAKAIFVQGNSYFSYYLEYTSVLPYALRWFASIASMVFYIYIATLPKKKQCILPMVLYLGLGIVSLFYGQRNHIVMRFLIILTYLYYRQKMCPDGEQWIPQRIGLYLGLGLPTAIIFLSYWGMAREGKIFEIESLWNAIIGQLSDTGNSISVIGYGYEYADVLPSRNWYSLGSVISLLRNNAFSGMLGVQPVPVEANSVETALNGYSFASALMYQQAPYAFQAGRGMGSCYIAEVFYDFGYVGVVIVNILFGYLCIAATNVKTRNFLTLAVGLCSFYYIVYSPRSATDNFISVPLQLANLIILLGMYMLYRIKLK